ncbi:MAG: hypothetical protein IH944_00510 [Armatimonadetes bacterium]|nr:hypothetical protein [Armatimonadota bacterium]
MIVVTVETLDWMSGSWECEIWGGRFEEHWMAPKRGTMQGVGRFEKDGKIEFMEFMSIEGSGDALTLYMILGAPSKGDKSPVAFRLSEHDSAHACFERSDDDYPKRIVYTKGDSDTMLCRIDGVQDGEPTSDEFAFRRVTP